jgi:hypothetical protein
MEMVVGWESVVIDPILLLELIGVEKSRCAIMRSGKTKVRDERTTKGKMGSMR